MSEELCYVIVSLEPFNVDSSKIHICIHFISVALLLSYARGNQTTDFLVEL